MHNGFIRVWGKAPDGLHWELGVRRGHPPLAVFAPGGGGSRARLWVGAMVEA